MISSIHPFPGCTLSRKLAIVANFTDKTPARTEQRSQSGWPGGKGSFFGHFMGHGVFFFFSLIGFISKVNPLGHCDHFAPRGLSVLTIPRWTGTSRPHWRRTTSPPVRLAIPVPKAGSSWTVLARSSLRRNWPWAS